MDLETFVSTVSSQPIAFSSKLESLMEEWDKTEEVLKIAEVATKNAISPAIWELRYAGRRVVDALLAYKNGKPNEQIISLLDDAIFDCHRARHDAIDATIAFFAKKIEIASNAFEGGILEKEFPSFLKLNDLVIAIQEKIQKSRRDRLKRDCTYIETANKEFEECCILFKSFETSILLIKPLKMRSRLKFLIKKALFFLLLLNIFISFFIGLPLLSQEL